MEIKEPLRGFVAHGADFTGTRESSRGNQAYGHCPFCDKENHFFVNVSNRLWDCKRCGLRGNFPQFLEEISKRNIKAFNDKALTRLAIDRKLPKSAFTNWDLGWDGQYYTLPVRNAQGVIEDLRRYRIGQKMQATAGASLGLLGAEHFHRHPGWPVYVCEGEWDAIALVWLFRKLAYKASVVAVPGAPIFKQLWGMMFSGRKVALLYDHDQAGENGRKLAWERIRGIASDVKWAEWPVALPAGYDVRDLICTEAIRGAKPRYAFKHLHDLLVAPEVKPGEVQTAPGATSEAPPAKLEGNGPRVPCEEVLAAYRKWLHIHNDEPLQVLFGSIFANRLQGDPLWLFFVAPPGGMKSELLMSLSRHAAIESTTSLTPHTLVSGANFGSGNDPSLLPKLNGRILVIKDFTTILTMHYSSRDEIFGVLRDCYDGKTEKIFGTGLKRSYVSHFGVLAGVTPAIESFGVMHQSLGERFLKYRLSAGEKNMTESDRIRRALKNINQEVKMREELCNIANKVLNSGMPKEIPTIPDEIFEQFICLAQTTAMMRGVVERDRFTQSVQYKPSIEVGTRLAKQMAKLAMGISIYQGKKVVDASVYDMCRRIALDTAPDRVEEIVRQIWHGTPTEEDALKTSEVSTRTRLPVPTVFRVLQDLELLKLVDRVGTGNKYEWRIGKKLAGLLAGGKVYTRKETPPA